jgi:hypothetical protein
MNVMSLRRCIMLAIDTLLLCFMSKLAVFIMQPLAIMLGVKMENRKSLRRTKQRIENGVLYVKILNSVILPVEHKAMNDDKYCLKTTSFSSTMANFVNKYGKKSLAVTAHTSQCSLCKTNCSQSYSETDIFI